MIKLIKNSSNLLSNIQNKIIADRSLEGITRFYKEFIANYKSLDRKFGFTEYLDEDFIFSQLSTVSQQRDLPLFAIPIGVKDVFNTKVLPTSMGSDLWRGFKAGNNSRVVDQLVNDGGIIFSKTTTAEFAVHFITPEKTLNPYNPKHITGTSSSGSAVAVACGALPVALGTQTAGSIIRPASFCGVYGFKPSFGAIDRTGVLKTNDTFDTIGLLGSDISGINKIFLHALVKGNDYPFSKNYFTRLDEFRTKGSKKLRIGIVTDAFQGYSNYASYVKNDFNSAISKISKVFDPVELTNANFINDIHPLHELMYAKSLSYYFKQEMKQHDHISEIMVAMMKKGEAISEMEYVEASKIQPKLRKEFDKVFEDYDFLITPATATEAPPLRQWEIPDTCLIWTYLGYPALSIPLFINSETNLPFGLQIVAKKFDDFALLDFSKTIEEMFV